MRPLPPSTSPRLLMRVVARIGAGVRRPRALAEVLDLELAVVEDALEAGEWLGLLHRDPEPWLTAAGLACHLGGPSRAEAYGELVRGHAVLGPLVDVRDVHDLDPFVALVEARAPSLSRADARRAARGIRRLVLPARSAGRSLRRGRQLGIAFGASPVPRRPALDLRAGSDENPDVYTFVLRTLLDHGELTLAQLRGALDALGGAGCGLGGYVAMAQRRGDAHRVGETLVVSRGALSRAAIADSPVTVALSDPDFRAWLDGILAGRGTVSGRYRAWLTRLWPGWEKEPAALPAFLSRGLDRLLFGRPLATVPIAGAPGDPLPTEAAPFLTVATKRHLAVAFPSDLAQLVGGLATINRALRSATVEANQARPPGPADRRLVVHGGLLHPGEAPVRMIPDGVSLRLRAASHVPAFGLLLALGVLDRRGSLTLHSRGEEILAALPGRPPRSIDHAVTALATARGWHVVRGPQSATWTALADLGEQLGLLARLRDRYTLDEAFFLRLGTDAEHRDVWEGLQPLAEALLDHLAPPLGE